MACFSQTSFLPFRELKKIEWVSLVLELSKRTSVFPPASVKWKQTRKTAKRDTKNPKGRHVSFACAMLEARGSHLPRYRFFLVLWPRRPGEMVIIIYEAPTVVFKVPISFCHKKFRKIRLERKHDYRKISGSNGTSEKVVLFFLGRTFQKEIRVPFLGFLQ